MYTSYILYERSKSLAICGINIAVSCFDLWFEGVVLTQLPWLVYGNKSAKRLVPLEKKD
jgi:hypothetical protein